MKLTGSNTKPTKAAAEITMPKVASNLAPCLSDNQPLIGPVKTNPIDIGIINIPAKTALNQNCTHAEEAKFPEAK